LDVIERGVTHFYEHEASQSSAILASINPMMCDDWLASASRILLRVYNPNFYKVQLDYCRDTCKKLERTFGACRKNPYGYDPKGNQVKTNNYDPKIMYMKILSLADKPHKQS
jgi:hypothetical protein